MSPTYELYLELCDVLREVEYLEDCVKKLVLIRARTNAMEQLLRNYGCQEAL